MSEQSASTPETSQPATTGPTPSHPHSHPHSHPDRPYLSAVQLAKLLEPINPDRVSKDGKGFSHVEAWEIRAQLTRILGFGRWSQEVVLQELVFETSEQRRRRDQHGEEIGDPYTVWTVAYRSMVRLTVCAPDGTELATYTEGAIGDATNQPSRADAHDLALKTSQSQALKRCAVNIGDQFGLSLYNSGSTRRVVARTLVYAADLQTALQTVQQAVRESGRQTVRDAAGRETGREGSR